VATFYAARSEIITPLPWPTFALPFSPDWEPVKWTEADRKKGQAWGLKTIDTFHTHGTPPVD
jgi:hypothetical protein